MGGPWIGVSGVFQPGSEGIMYGARTGGGGGRRKPLWGKGLRGMGGGVEWVGARETLAAYGALWRNWPGLGTVGGSNFVQEALIMGNWPWLESLAWVQPANTVWERVSRRWTCPAQAPSPSPQSRGVQAARARRLAGSPVSNSRTRPSYRATCRVVGS